jgi:hypothetical protein
MRTEIIGFVVGSLIAIYSKSSGHGQVGTDCEGLSLALLNPSVKQLRLVSETGLNDNNLMDMGPMSLESDIYLMISTRNSSRNT